jgi:hypothetical protein
VAAEHSPDVDPDPALATRLVAARQQGDATLERLSTTALQIVDGWSSAMHAFDHNIDRSGPGTIDAPAGKIAERTTGVRDPSRRGAPRSVGEPRRRSPLRHPLAGRAR